MDITESLFANSYNQWAGYINAVNEFFNNDSRVIASAMNIEFQRQRNAWQLRQTTHRKIGSIDSGRLWAHRTSDNIFKSATIQPNGQNHGIFMVVDWSGSMAGLVSQMAQQCLVVARFCKMANIPFKVFTFTDGSNSVPINMPTQIVTNNVHQVEVMNSSMTMEQIQNVYNLMSLRRRGIYNCLKNDVQATMREWLGMGGTPLAESMILTYIEAYKFKQEHKIEDMSILYITDGEGGNLKSTGQYNINSIIDPFTKKSHILHDRYCDSLGVVNRMIRESGINVFNMFIGSSDLHSSAYGFSRGNDYRFSENGGRGVLDKMRESLGKPKNGMLAVKNLAFFNEVIFVRKNMFSIVTEDDDPVSTKSVDYDNMTVSKIKNMIMKDKKWRRNASAFGSYLAGKICEKYRLDVSSQFN